MSGLGELLELIHTSDSRWRTLRVEGREWRLESLLSEAFVQGVGECSSMVTFHKEKNAPEVTENRWRLWLAPPDRVRAEFAAGDETVTAVLEGSTWWSFSPSQGGRTNNGDEHHQHGVGSGEALIHPARFLPALVLETPERTSFLERPSLRVRAHPFDQDDDDEQRHRLHGLGSGADEYELIVDSERGVLLRSEARLRQRAFRVLETEAVAFDEDFPSGTFEITLPTGEVFESAQRVRTLMLEELPGAVRFTVLVPATSPGAPSYVDLDSGDRRSGVPESVHISYSTDKAGGGNIVVWESAESLPGRESVKWHEADGAQGGRDNRFDAPLNLARLFLLGTHVELSSHDTPTARLVELARDLVPLPAEPPRLIQTPSPPNAGPSALALRTELKDLRWRATLAHSRRRSTTSSPRGPNFVGMGRISVAIPSEAAPDGDDRRSPICLGTDRRTHEEARIGGRLGRARLEPTHELQSRLEFRYPTRRSEDDPGRILTGRRPLG